MWEPGRIPDGGGWRHAQHDITTHEAFTDNAWNYTHSRDFRTVLAVLGATHIRTRPHSPWQNRKAERLNPTLQENRACRHPFTSNQDRTDAPAPRLEHYNHARPHTTCQGPPPPPERHHRSNRVHLAAFGTVAGWWVCPAEALTLTLRQGRTLMA